MNRNTGTRVLLFQDHKYNQARIQENGRVFWRCSKKGCKAVVWTSSWTNATVLKKKFDHTNNCSVSYNKIMADELVWDMKKMKRGTRATSHAIINECTMEVSDEVCSELPSQEALKRCFHRIAGSAQKTSDVLNYVIPEELSKFVQSDIKYIDFNRKTKRNEPKRMLAFADLNAMTDSPSLIFGDGTFDKAPIGFYQIYSWHARVGKK